MALLSNIITPSNVLKDSDIGTSVQAYDADTTKNDVANTFTANQTINANLIVDTNTLYVDATNNRVGIGASPSYKLDVSGVTKSTSFLETVVAVTGTTPAISAINGNVQTWTLSGNSTPTDSLNAGESITLMIDDGSAYTITWTSLVDQWVGGSAPTLATTGYSVVELWKVSTTVYAAYVGDAN